MSDLPGGSHSGQGSEPGRAFPGFVLFPAADLVDLCGQTWQGAGLLLRSHSASRRFYFVAPDTDCWLWMRAAAAGDRIRFQFRFFLVYSLAAAARAPPASPASNASSTAPADPCAPGSYLQFYEGPPGAPRPLGAPLCGLTIPAAVASSGPFLGLRLLTRGRQPRVDFVGDATSFRLGGWGLLAGTGGPEPGAAVGLGSPVWHLQCGGWGRLLEPGRGWGKGTGSGLSALPGGGGGGKGAFQTPGVDPINLTPRAPMAVPLPAADMRPHTLTHSQLPRTPTPDTQYPHAHCTLIHTAPHAHTSRLNTHARFLPHILCTHSHHPHAHTQPPAHPPCTLIHTTPSHTSHPTPTLTVLNPHGLHTHLHILTHSPVHNSLSHTIPTLPHLTSNTTHTPMLTGPIPYSHTSRLNTPPHTAHTPTHPAHSFT